jgi:FkbM family methyltransferase
MLPGFGEMVLRPGNSDMEVIRQIFGERDYDLSGFPQYEKIMAAYSGILDEGCRPIIIDAGANIGASTVFFAEAFPEALVLAIEPEADSARLCEVNASARMNTRTIVAALGGSEGNVSLDVPPGRSWAVRTERSPSGATPLVTIPGLLAEEGSKARLLIVKIDIEGFESDVFEHAAEWIHEPAAILVEIHDWLYPGGGTSRSLFRAAAELEGDVMIRGENLVFIR